MSSPILSFLNECVNPADEMIQMVRISLVIHLGSGVPEETADSMAGLVRDGGCIRTGGEHKPSVAWLIRPCDPSSLISSEVRAKSLACPL
jgi:hypothetical protein